MTENNPWANIRSETLGFLRTLEYAKQFVGPIAQLVVVVDANVVLSDLIWLVEKRRDPNASTSVAECIKAGTFVAYMSRSALSEVEEHIPRIAKEKNLSPAKMNAEWKRYRKLLKVRTPKESIVDKYRDGQDPDDAPHLALADQLDAIGILSKDSDLVAMGGLVLEMNFATNARDYSRKMAVAVAIKTLGGTSILSAVMATQITGQIIGEAMRSFARLPPAVKLLIMVAILLLLSNDSVQAGAKKTFLRIREAATDIAPDALVFLSNAFEMYRENRIPPPVVAYKS